MNQFITLWEDNSERAAKARLGFRLVDKYMDYDMHSKGAQVMMAYIYNKYCE
jgi:hypothetical protein